MKDRSKLGGGWVKGEEEESKLRRCLSVLLECRGWGVGESRLCGRTPGELVSHGEKLRPGPMAMGCAGRCLAGTRFAAPQGWWRAENGAQWTEVRTS